VSNRKFVLTFGINRRSLHCAGPGFPVELGGVGELHAAFFTESRTRGRF
jgi:hypothetical protein